MQVSGLQIHIKRTLLRPSSRQSLLGDQTRNYFKQFSMMEEGDDGNFSLKKKDVSESLKHQKTSNNLKTKRQKLKQSKSFSNFSHFSYLLLQLIVFSFTIAHYSSTLHAASASGKVFNTIRFICIRTVIF